jgi:hypothetical protein
MNQYIFSVFKIIKYFYETLIGIYAEKIIRKYDISSKLKVIFTFQIPVKL